MVVAKILIKNINRLNDVYFKFLLGTENRKSLTLSFINSILNRVDDNRFVNIEFVNTNLTAELEDEKIPIVDILAKTGTGEFINIEVQVAKQTFFRKRSLYYWSRLYGRQLNVGKHYRKLKQTIMINLLSFDCLPYDVCHNCYHVRNDSNNDLLLDDLEIHFIELQKFKFSDVRKLRDSENWIAYFSPNCSNEEREAIAMGNPAIKEALNAERVFSQDELQFARYEHAEKVLRDYNAAIEDNRQEARQEGILEGQQLEKFINARNLLRLGIAPDIVAQGVGLAIEDVLNLKSK